MKEEKYYLKVQPARSEIVELLRIEKKPSALVFRGTAPA